MRNEGGIGQTLRPGRVLDRLGTSGERLQWAPQTAPSTDGKNQDTGARQGVARPKEHSERTTEGDSANTDRADAGLGLDEVFGILKNRRRRDVIEFLRDQGGETTLGPLSEHIAAKENDTTVQQINSDQRKRVYVGLYQSHLPKMDDMDIVEFDKNRGTIRLGPNVDRLEPYLDASDSESEWWRLYAAIAGTGLTLGPAALLLTGSAAGTAVVALGTAVLSGATALLHARRERETETG